MYKLFFASFLLFSLPTHAADSLPNYDFTSGTFTLPLVNTQQGTWRATLKLMTSTSPFYFQLTNVQQIDATAISTSSQGLSSPFFDFDTGILTTPYVNSQNGYYNGVLQLTPNASSNVVQFLLSSVVATSAPPTVPSVTPTPNPSTTTTVSADLCSSTGASYYVSHTGSDANVGSRTAPWQTIQKAMNSATPGSTVNIMAGSYTEKLTMNVQGTSGAGNCITFQPNNFNVPASGCGGFTGVACGGDQAILDYASLGTDTTTTPFLLISGKSYIRIQGLTFQNYTHNGTFGQGMRIDNAANTVELKYNKFLNNKETGAWNGCCRFMNFLTWEATNVRVYGNEFGNLVTNYAEAMDADGNTQFFTAESNWFHDTDGIAIDIHGGANHYTIRGNKLEYIGVKRDGSLYYPNAYAAAIYNDGGNTGVIERNFLDHTADGLVALTEPGGPQAHDIIMRNNIVQNSHTGMVLGTFYNNAADVYNISAFNNTFYHNTLGVIVKPMVDSTLVWKNNIFANNGTSYGSSVSPGTASNNLYFGGGSGAGATVTSDPQFVNPAAGNFVLQSTSPAINAGNSGTTDTQAGTTDFAGNARFKGIIDIGAYEF